MSQTGGTYPAQRGRLGGLSKGGYYDTQTNRMGAYGPDAVAVWGLWIWLNRMGVWMTFQDFIKRHNCTEDETEKLIVYLIALRIRQMLGWLGW